MAGMLEIAPSLNWDDKLRTDKEYLDRAQSNARIPDYSDGHWIKLPEALFAAIMSVEPMINVMHRQSKELSDEWLQSAMQMDEKTASTWKKLDIAYMSAISAPHASVESLKLMNDWNGWVFAFDDPFDAGDFDKDPIKAAELVIHTLSVLDDIHPEVSPEESTSRHVLQSCWMRFRRQASLGLQHRWKRQLTMYCLGVLQQVNAQRGTCTPTVEEYMDMRAACVGALPCIGLMEFAEGIDLPQHVTDHPALKAIERITCDLITLQNDICSYKKDIMMNEYSNIIFILKDQGLSDQEAVDQVGEMLYGCYQRWYEALRDLPSWGEDVDQAVTTFVNGCRNIALGNLHWSFYTPRYLGTEGQEIKRSLMMRLD